MSRRQSHPAWPVLWAAPLLVGCSVDHAGAEPRTRTVEISQMAFHPAELRAQPGDTIEWINRDIVPHTATAPDSAWTSPPLAEGERWRMVVGADASGEYLCAFHPVMEARLTVEQTPPVQEQTQ